MSNTKIVFTADEIAFFVDVLPHLLSKDRTEIETTLNRFGAETPKLNLTPPTVALALVRQFILRTNPYILDIDFANVVKMLKDENYVYVSNDRFYEERDE